MDCLFLLLSIIPLVYTQKTPMEMYQSFRGTSPKLEANETKIFRVAAVLVEPFVLIKHGCEAKNNSSLECKGNHRYDGYCIDLLKKLQDKIEDFEYEIFLSEDNKFGAQQADGTWDGIIGSLLRKKADLGIGPFTITQERQRVVDFSIPFMTSGISIMIKKPDKMELSSTFSFLTTKPWLYFLLALITIFILLLLLTTIFSPLKEPSSRNASFLTKIGHFSDLFQKSRLPIAFWWIISILLTASFLAALFSASIFSLSHIQKYNPLIESLEDLLRLNHIKFGIQKGGSTENFFKHSTIATYKSMWDTMHAQEPSVFVASYAEGIERVRDGRGNYAFLLESSANDYASSRKPCDTMKVGSNLNTVFYGLPTQKGSKWRELLDMAILDLQEKGELKKLENKWWYDRGQCEHSSTDQYHTYWNDDFSLFKWIFYILLGGFIIWLILSIAKLIYFRISAKSKNRKQLTKSREDENMKFSEVVP